VGFRHLREELTYLLNGFLTNEGKTWNFWLLV
jgi:hypothetical protein